MNGGVTLMDEQRLRQCEQEELQDEMATKLQEYNKAKLSQVLVNE